MKAQRVDRNWSRTRHLKRIRPTKSKHDDLLNMVNTVPSKTNLYGTPQKRRFLLGIIDFSFHSHRIHVWYIYLHLA